MSPYSAGFSLRALVGGDGCPSVREISLAVRTPGGPFPFSHCMIRYSIMAQKKELEDVRPGGSSSSNLAWR